jgi:uncharacterized protein
VCVNLDVAQLDLELNKLFSEIQKLGAPPDLLSEQQIWLRYRNSCMNDDHPNGFRSIIYCVRAAYTIRRDQLLSIALDLRAKNTAPVISNWAPIPVQR